MTKLQSFYETEEDYDEHICAEYYITNFTDSQFVAEDDDGNSRVFKYTSEYDENTFENTYTITFDDGKRVKVTLDTSSYSSPAKYNIVSN